MVWRKCVKNVLLLLFANIITPYQLSQFLLKKSNYQNSPFLSKGRLVNIKIQDFLES